MGDALKQLVESAAASPGLEVVQLHATRMSKTEFFSFLMGDGPIYDEDGSILTHICTGAHSSCDFFSTCFQVLWLRFPDLALGDQTFLRVSHLHRAWELFTEETKSDFLLDMG